jgi:PAS domain-containing protein
VHASGVVEGAASTNRIVRYLNPQAERMAGVTSVEALGRFCGDVLKPWCRKDGRRPQTACSILFAREREQAQATEFLERPDARSDGHHHRASMGTACRR